MIYIILGAVQGIVEWLPVSSEGVLVLLQARFLESASSFQMIQLALFLHLGTFFSALIYFRGDVLRIFKTLFSYKKADKENRKIFQFLLFTTLLSGAIGGVLLWAIKYVSLSFEFGGRIITLLVGILLLGTAVIMLSAKKEGLRQAKDINKKDIILLGVVQGLAILPGFSRSGLTTSALLLKKFDDAFCLRLSFLMSLPVVLGANIVLGFLNLGGFYFSLEALFGLLAAFIFGILTIHLLLKLAKKIRFGYFVLIFGILVILSVFV